MNIRPFILERYFAKYEFTVEYLLSCSDCEAMLLPDLISMASEDTASLWKNLKLEYTESSGHPLLRKEISGLYEGLTPENTLVSAPEEAIFLFMQAVLEPGNHVVCTKPGYQSLYEIANSLGCTVSGWEPEENAGWTFTVEKLESLLTNETRLVVMNFPHNPTGFAPTEVEFNKMVTLVKEKGAYLLSDEMYRYLEIRSGSTLTSACELYENAFTLFGLSKSFGLPGLRIGWMASPNVQILNRMQELKDYTTICSPGPSEILAIIALQNREQIISSQITRVRKNLNILNAFIQRNQDIFSLNQPVGGSVCFPRMVNVGSTGDFCESLVKDTSIMLIPSKMFEWGDAHIRIGLGRDNFGKALNLLEEYL